MPSFCFASVEYRSEEVHRCFFYPSPPRPFTPDRTPAGTTSGLHGTVGRQSVSEVRCTHLRDMYSTVGDSAQAIVTHLKGSLRVGAL